MQSILHIKILRILLFTAFTCCFSVSYGYSFIGTLDYYGFTSKEQKHALQDLLQKADIIPINKTLEQTFPSKEKNEEIIPDIINILQQTQKSFVERSGEQERWQAKPLEWINSNKKEILADLKVLGFISAIVPKHKSTDAFCILGSSASGMANRIEYANFLIKNNLFTKKIILLAGERYVTEDVDGSRAELLQIANKFKVTDWTKLTETHLIQHEYSKSALSNDKNIEVHIIDTSRDNLPRPTTQTTVLKVVEWLKDHTEVQSIIFVSNQPYVKYQEAIIEAVFKEKNVNVKYEVIGSAAQNVDELQSMIENLGTYIWAKTPAVLAAMNIQITNNSIRESLKELYAKNILIYKAIPQNFMQ